MTVTCRADHQGRVVGVQRGQRNSQQVLFAGDVAKTAQRQRSGLMTGLRTDRLCVCVYTACYQNTSDAYLRWHAAPSLGAHSQTDFDQPDSSWPGAPDSVERCNQLCLSTGVAFKYFGMQAGHACFCGMDYGHQGKAPDADCNKPCLGNASQMCGGPFLNSVWATQPI